MKRAWSLVLVAAVLAGCGSDPQVVDVEGGGHLLVGGSSRGGDDALMTGTVAMVGSCFGIIGELDAQHVVIWPSGTELVDDGTTIDVPDVGRFQVGDQVSLSGGYHGPPFPDRVPDLPDGCPDDEVAVANSNQSG